MLARDRRVAARLALAAAAACLLPAPASADKTSPRRVEISARDAKARGLFAVGVSLDIGAGGLTATKFPAKDLYLVVSGPPGGPLGLEIRKGSLTKQCKPLPGALKPKGNARIRVGGRKLAASAYTEGESLARRHGCTVALRQRASLLILRFWSGAGKTAHPGCAALARQRPFRTLLPSLRVTTK